MDFAAKNVGFWERRQDAVVFSGFVERCDVSHVCQQRPADMAQVDDGKTAAAQLNVGKETIPVDLNAERGALERNPFDDPAPRRGRAR